MALNNNSIGIFSSSSSSSSGGGGCCGVVSLGMSEGFGISITSSSTNPITDSGTFTITNICPYLGQSVIVLGSGTCSSLRCGVNNTSSGNYSATLGGKDNTNSSSNSSISGGSTNTINGVGLSFIGGGCKNTITSSNSTIFGGLCNNACSSLGTTIIGGLCHNVGENSSMYSFVGGGLCNKALCECNVVLLGGVCNTICCQSSLGGGECNCVVGSCSNIVGGLRNVSNGNSNFIFGGKTNCINGCFSTIGGGVENTIVGDYSLVLGSSNILCSSYGLVTNSFNCVFCDFNTNYGYTNKICVDENNFSFGTLNTICGFSNTNSGYLNCIGGDTEYCLSYISNGITNKISSSIYSSIINSKDSCQSCSRYSNNITTCNSNITLGCFNETNGKCNLINNVIDNVINNNFIPNFNTISNGEFNCIGGSLNSLLVYCNDYGLILNGSCNLITSQNCSCYPTLLSGCLNTNNSNFSLIGNGYYNTLTSQESTCGFGSGLIGGIGNNTFSGYFDLASYTFTTLPQSQLVSQFSYVIGGFQNVAFSNPYNFVIGGCQNIVSQKYGNIIGGACNSISVTPNQDKSTIIGGFLNLISNYGKNFIGGGCCNQIYDNQNLIFGGCNNLISGNVQPYLYTNICSFIGGGKNNCICGCGCFNSIGGGESNINFGKYNNILGGQNNSIGTITFYNCENSLILGGICNQICGSNSAILGGSYNCVSSNNSFVIGSNINAIYDNTTYVNSLVFCDTLQTCNPPFSINLGWNDTTKKVIVVCDSTLTSFGLCSFTNLSPQESNVGFNVIGGSPICGAGASGLICLGLGKSGGSCNEYLSGANKNETIPNISSGGGVFYYLNGSVSVADGQQLSPNPILTNPSTNFTTTSDGKISKFITDINSPNLQIVPNGIWIINTFFSIDFGTIVDIYAELYSYDGVTFTLLNTGSSVKVDGTDITRYTLSVPLTNPPLFSPSTRFAIQFNVTNLSGSGSTLTQYTESIYVGSVSTTFPSGLGSLNTLITSSQNFTTTTSGTNFSITSLNCTHCFNLPTATTSQSGALSCQDWGVFNSKQSTTYPANSFYANPTNTIANAITRTYCFSNKGCLDVNISWTPSSGTVTITPPIKLNFQSGEYIYTKIGSLVYFCYSFCWGGGQFGQISASSSANNIVFAFNNPSFLPKPCTNTLGGGNNTFNLAIGEVTLGCDLDFGVTFRSMQQAPTATSTSNVFQRMGLVCCTTCPQLPNLTFTKGVLQAPYPTTFNYMSGFMVYQGV